MLQIAHIILQILEVGSLLRECGGRVRVVTIIDSTLIKIIDSPSSKRRAA